MSRLEIIEGLRNNGSEYIRNNMSNLINELKTKLEMKELNLCDLVEGLESTLKNPNPADRALGTRFLVDVLQELSLTKVNSQELVFLSAFFVDRLKDHHSVVPHVILGFLALVKQSNISPEEVKSLVQALFREVHCQSQMMADRRNIYNFIKFCVLNKTEEMKQMGSEVVLGFIQAMEGEKDPRNLLLLFHLFPHVALSLPLDAFKEDLFEVIAAYFPIDFVPPKNNPYGVLPEDLILGLRRCLSCTEEFAPFCIPLLGEKLDSDVIASKMDALLTMRACFETYSASSLRPHCLPLFASLRREVVEGWNGGVEEAAIEALSALMAALERGPSSQSLKDSIQQLGDSALSECAPHLSSPEQRLMMPSCRLLLAVCSASSALTSDVCRKVLPLLCAQFSSRVEPVARKNTLLALARVLRQGQRFHVFSQESLKECQHLCFDALCQGLASSDVSVREAAVASLQLALDALMEDQVRRAGTALTLMITSGSDPSQGNESYKIANESLRHAAVAALTAIGAAHPSVLVEDVLPHLLSGLRKGAFETEADLKSVLETLSALGEGVTSLREVLPVVWGEASRLAGEGEAECIQHLLCVNKMVEGSADKGDSMEYLCSQWKGLLKCQILALGCIKAGEFSDPVPILEQVSSICQALVRRENAAFVGRLVEVLLARRDPASEPGLEALAARFSFRDLEELNRGRRSDLLVYCLQGLAPLGSPPLEKEVLEVVQSWARGAKDERGRARAGVLFAAHILNATEESLSPLLAELDSGFSLKEIESLDPDTMTSSVLFLGWVVKGLVMRGYRGDLAWVKKLENLLLHPRLGEAASECFSTLLREVPFLGPSSAGGAKAFRMLYKQRFFERRLTPLLTQFSEAEGKGRTNTLLAISRLLPCLPQEVLKGHLQKLLPVLSLGLTCSDSVVTSGTVETLSSLLRHNVEDVTSHVSSLIPPLLKLSVESPLIVRVKALECMEALAQLSPIAIMPLKAEVVPGLRAALGDRKRVVRRAATNARCAWVLV